MSRAARRRALRAGKAGDGPRPLEAGQAVGTEERGDPAGGRDGGGSPLPGPAPDPRRTAGYLKLAIGLTSLALGRGPSYPEAREALDKVAAEDLRGLLAAAIGLNALLVEDLARRTRRPPLDLVVLLEKMAEEAPE